MAIQVLIPAPMRGLTGNRSKVAISEGATVGEVLTTLTTQYPSVRERIFEPSGRLRRFVNVYLNGEDVRGLAAEATPVKSGDEIGIIPAMAGGTTRPGHASA
jgi:molybdopterin synthase sulfur carrier subunit